ncbi:MAG: metal ABC transporter permease [Pseudomonadales bacterium]
MPAFLAGLLVVATHVPLGQEVLRRGIIFIDLAIAQIAGMGVIAAHSMGWDPHGLEVQAAALGSALVGAIFLSWTERRWQATQEALIGVVFVLAASASLLWLASDPHGGEHLKELMVGQILWVEFAALKWVAALTVLVLALWFGLRARLSHIGFYLLFALSVTASVQLVGVYLVFATLIIPALASLHFNGATRLLLAYALGAAAYAIGLIASALLDLPSGAVIVCSLALLSIAVWLVSARRVGEKSKI